MECEVRANGSARDAACLPFRMVGEVRRTLGPIALAVLLLSMGVMDIRVSAEFPCLEPLHRKALQEDDPADARHAKSRR